METSLPSLLFERWATGRGPAWLAFAAPLKEILRDEPETPSNLKRDIEPLRWIMRQAQKGLLSIDSNAIMERATAIEANRRFGFVSPPTVDGEPTYLEIEMLLTLARNMGSTTPGESCEELTDCGRIIFRNPTIVWKEASTALGLCRPPGLTGELWEFALAWLLQPDIPVNSLFPLIDEAARIEKVDLSDEDGYVTLFTTGLFSLYTLLRGLNMFEPEESNRSKPLLSEMGRATAILALRASIFHQHIHHPS